jgi:GntR family transcriptional regulator / MocR family aminotransferase
MASRSAVPAIQLLGEPESDGVPLHARVYRTLRSHILGGTLGPGARLPSARGLAADLGVSRNTVESAFLQLAAEGYIVRRTGSGTYVADTLPEVAPFRPRRTAGVTGAPPRLARRGRRIAELGTTEIERDGQTGPCASDVDAFPAAIWNRILARQARRAGREALLPADSAGMPQLRRAIAEHLALTRGVRCEPGQVVVVNGTQQAVDLVARLLLDAGAVAAMEEPGYPSAWAALVAGGARVRGIPVDRDGLRTELLAARRGPALVYVTPSHQYPLGVTLSLARRLSLLSWAAARAAWIVEDDYDSEFHYEGRPLAALQGLDSAGRTIYVGTFNKVLFPGIRLAYLVVPPALADAFAAGRRLLDGFSPPLPQLALAEFLARGHFAAHLRQARGVYAARRDLLLRQAGRTWGDAVRLGPSATGLHLVALLPGGSDDRRIARAAPAGGMTVAPLSEYYRSGTGRPGLLLSFGGAAPERIRRTVEALAPLITRQSGIIPPL